MDNFISYSKKLETTQEEPVVEETAQCDELQSFMEFTAGQDMSQQQQQPQQQEQEPQQAPQLIQREQLANKYQMVFPRYILPYVRTIYDVEQLLSQIRQDTRHIRGSNTLDRRTGVTMDQRSFRRAGISQNQSLSQ